MNPITRLAFFSVSALILIALLAAGAVAIYQFGYSGGYQQALSAVPEAGSVALPPFWMGPRPVFFPVFLLCGTVFAAFLLTGMLRSTFPFFRMGRHPFHMHRHPRNMEAWWRECYGSESETDDAKPGPETKSAS